MDASALEFRDREHDDLGEALSLADRSLRPSSRLVTVFAAVSFALSGLLAE